MSDWIEVTPETMPGEHQSIWFYVPHPFINWGVHYGRRIGDVYYNELQNNIITRSWGERFVTHWMPANIPAPPEVK